MDVTGAVGVSYETVLCALENAFSLVADGSGQVNADHKRPDFCHIFPNFDTQINSKVGELKNYESSSESRSPKVKGLVIIPEKRSS